MPCDPLRDLRAWQERLERLAARSGSAWDPPIDVYETAARYIVTAEVPGVAREHIELYATSGLPQGVVPAADNQGMGLKERAAATMAAGYRVYRVDGGILPSTGRGQAAQSLAREVLDVRGDQVRHARSGPVQVHLRSSPVD